MSSRIAALAAAATAAAVVAVPVLADTSPDGKTITFKELDKGSRFDYIDNPPKNPPHKAPKFSVGDQFVIGNPLKDSQGADGDLRAVCTTTKPAPASNSTNINTTHPICVGGFTLRDGTIFVDVADAGAKGTHGAITGGTGAYAGARGTLDSVNTKTGANDTITLLP
jgi:hypothetical protein